MTTKPEVKLPELPLEGVKVQSPVDGTMHKAGFTANQMQTYAKQYGTLCYEAGLSAGRVQAEQKEEIDDLKKKVVILQGALKWLRPLSRTQDEYQRITEKLEETKI